MFARQLYEDMREQAQSEAESYEGGDLTDLIESVTTIKDEQKHKEALSRAEEMEAKRDADTAILGRTFIRDADGANAFSKLSRYEAAIERQLYRALHELERLQRARTGGDVPAPEALDVDVSGIPEGDS